MAAGVFGRAAVSAFYSCHSRDSWSYRFGCGSAAPGDSRACLLRLPRRAVRGFPTLENPLIRNPRPKEDVFSRHKRARRHGPHHAKCVSLRPPMSKTSAISDYRQNRIRQPEICALSLSRLGHSFRPGCNPQSAIRNPQSQKCRSVVPKYPLPNQIYSGTTPNNFRTIKIARVVVPELFPPSVQGFKLTQIIVRRNS